VSRVLPERRPGIARQAPRLLILAKDTFPPFRVDVSVLFGRELSSRGFHIDWIMQSEQPRPADAHCRWNGGVVWVGRTNRGESRLARVHKHWLDLLNDLRVLRLARPGEYDIVQVRDKSLAALPALWAARRSGAAFVYWLSFPEPESSTYLAKIGAARFPLLYRLRGWVLFHLLYRYVLPRADRVFVQSEQMKADLVSYGLPESRLVPVPMGVDLTDFEGIPIEPPPQDEPPTIAYLGTLAAERRIDFLVRCLALVLNERPDARLLLVGDADRMADLELLKSEARRLGILDHIEITGFLPRRQALRRVARATVCVSPFFPTPILNSTSPTKLVEYMALNRPVVANDHPEQRLVIEASAGGLCVPWDERAFAKAILTVIGDPAEAEQMGKRGRAYVEAHRDYKRIATWVEREYHDTVDRRASGKLASRVS